MDSLIDRYGRRLNYIRISVTDRCNLRCRYCMPEEGVDLFPHDQILRYEDILFLGRILSGMGVKRIRFTGGEPLVRKGLVDFLARFREEIPNVRIALTTNGSLLKEHARKICRLGLDSLSVSLDTLCPERFSWITRVGRLEQVLEGIEAVSGELPFPVKLNTVIIRGFNDDELPKLVKFARNGGLLLRLIEFMPLDRGVWSDDRYISVDEMLSKLPDCNGWRRVSTAELEASGPAVYYHNENTEQKLGLIAAVSHRFCSTCNRLRITASGELRPCLFSDFGIDIREALRVHDGDEVKRGLLEAAAKKPRRWLDVAVGSSHMSRIGG